METKKNPNSDPKRNQSVYLQLGLMFVLSLAFISLEYKTINHANATESVTMTTPSGPEEIAIITLPPAQHTPKITPVDVNLVDVVDNEIKIINKPVEITTPVNSKSTGKVTSVVVPATNVGSGNAGLDILYLPEMDFRVVEQIPLFPDCESVPKAEQMKCFNESLSKHIRRNFRYPTRAMQDNIQGRVNVEFVIDTDGSITVLRVRGPKGAALLEKEGARNINLLPKLIPGKQRGKAVKVKYAVPINFKLQ